MARDELETFMEGVTLSSLESQLGLEGEDSFHTTEVEAEELGEETDPRVATRAPTSLETVPAIRALTPLPKAMPGAFRAVAREPLALSLRRGGRRFGPFQLLGVLGRGGMAEVRLAYESLGEGQRRACVVKHVRREYADDEEVRAMFLEESRISPLLNHPNVVRTFGTGTVDGVPYIALELIDGVTARDLLELAAKKRLPIFVPIEIGLCVARALHYVHNLRDPSGAALGLVHRDVTPQNILISGTGRVKLVDFGIALYDGRVFQTQDGVTRGKVTYMAPEQISDGICSSRSDLFSLGVVLTELVSGEKLVQNRVLGVLSIPDLARLVDERLDRHPDVPARLRDLIGALCARQPERRPTDAQSVVRDLEELLGDAPSLRLPRFMRVEVLGESMPEPPAGELPPDEATLDDGGTSVRDALAGRAGERPSATGRAETWPPDPVTEPAFVASSPKKRR